MVLRSFLKHPAEFCVMFCHKNPVMFSSDENINFVRMSVLNYIRDCMIQSMQLFRYFFV